MAGKPFLLLFILIVFRFAAVAQTIKGEVLDMEDKKPVSGVSIVNIYTSFDIETSVDGSFVMAATGGQLLEFKKPGYKTARVRVPQGYIPSYFRIIMQKGIPQLEPVYVTHNTRYDYTNDSLRFHELYKHELDFPTMSTFDMISHPFSALSKKSREIWQFQEDYSEFEKEKYVDRTFNEAIVTKFTGLTGDSLHYFMRRYRPTYEQLRSMNDYTFFSFIKKSADSYRKPNEPRISQ